jgi:hypothetical protein
MHRLEASPSATSQQSVSCTQRSSLLAQVSTLTEQVPWVSADACASVGLLQKPPQQPMPLVQLLPRGAWLSFFDRFGTINAGARRKELKMQILAQLGTWTRTWKATG